MGLFGTLDTFRLADALRLLAATHKTGCLHVEGERRRGDVWLQDGALVEATIDRLLDGESDLVEVIFEMLRLEEGSFRLVPAEPPLTSDRQPVEIEGALGRATALLDEWRELVQIVPSLNHRVAISPKLPDGQVTLDAQRWRALVAVADGPPVMEVARRLGLGELDVVRLISDLVDVGVAVVEMPRTAHTPLAGAHVDASDDATRQLMASDPAQRTGAHLTAPGSLRYPPTMAVPVITSPTGWQ